MKKIILIFCIVFLMTGIVTPVPASDNLDVEIAPDGPISVPYDVTYFFYTHNAFEVNTQIEVERLLDLIYKSKKDYVVVYPAEEIFDLTQQMLVQFTEEHQSECWSKGKVRDYGDCLVLDIFWNKFDYNLVTVINNGDELYNAVQECKTHPTYDKVYRVSNDYLSYDAYLDNRLESIVADVYKKYGEDISAYLLHSTTEFIDSHDVHYIFISVGVISHYEYDEQHKEDSALERYYSILKNSVLIPITDDMTELEKITILQASVGNVVRTYEETNAPLREVTYSVGAGQCMHYTWVFKYLCDIYGIESMYVHGNVSWSTDSHAWNCVKYNGNWYMFDPQWNACSDGANWELKNMTLVLYNADKMKSSGYIWEEEDYPLCTADSIVKSGEDYMFDIPLSGNIKKYEMVEPFYSRDPVGGIPVKIYHDIYFDKETGTIHGIDSTLFENKYAKDSDGKWYVKDTVLEIPEKIDGVKVKKIAENLSFLRSEREEFYENALGGYYSKVIIPDGVVIGDLALCGLRTQLLEIGDNVTAGYSSLPDFYNGQSIIGENFTYKGDFSYYGDDKIYKKSYDYYEGYTGKEIVLYHSDATDLKNDSDYTRVYFSGYGCNIVDAEPVKTLTLCKETEYIDPRLNRLNRKYVIDSQNPYYTVIDGVLYNKDVTKLVCVPVGIAKIEIPDTVTEIGEYAFAYCHGLSDIVIPASVEKVGNRAFFHMSGLETVFFEGEVPDGFEPKVCGDFRQVFRSDASDKTADYIIDGANIRITGVPANGNTFTVFYNTSGMIIKIIRGTSAKIPLYAKSFETFCWDENLNPLTYKIEGEL